MIVHGRGLSNLNLGCFVCSFDVRRASKPFPSINYDLTLQSLGIGPGATLVGGEYSHHCISPAP